MPLPFQNWSLAFSMLHCILPPGNPHGASRLLTLTQSCIIGHSGFGVFIFWAEDLLVLLTLSPAENQRSYSCLCSYKLTLQIPLHNNNTFVPINSVPPGAPSLTQSLGTPLSCQPQGKFEPGKENSVITSRASKLTYLT